MRVLGYTRVSTDEQGESGLGLAAQEEAIRSECERRGWELTAIERDVASGGTRRNRPGLERALAACRSHEVMGIVTSKLDRLTRSLLDFSTLVAEAQRGGWSLVVLDEGFDLSTANGRAMAGMLAVFAEYERELIGGRIRAAARVRRANGDATQVSEAARKRIIELAAKGLTQQAIAEALTKERIRPPRTSRRQTRRWHRSTVKRVLDEAGLTQRGTREPLAEAHRLRLAAFAGAQTHGRR